MNDTLVMVASGHLINFVIETSVLIGREAALSSLYLAVITLTNESMDIEPDKVMSAKLRAERLAERLTANRKTEKP